jgi:hypothetical protein
MSHSQNARLVNKHTLPIFFNPKVQCAYKEKQYPTEVF